MVWIRRGSGVVRLGRAWEFLLTRQVGVRGDVEPSQRLRSVCAESAQSPLRVRSESIEKSTQSPSRVHHRVHSESTQSPLKSPPKSPPRVHKVRYPKVHARVPESTPKSQSPPPRGPCQGPRQGPPRGPRVRHPKVHAKVHAKVHPTGSESTAPVVMVECAPPPALLPSRPPAASCSPSVSPCTLFPPFPAPAPH